MPKISLADQLDGLKTKLGGMFSRAKRPTADQAASRGANSDDGGTPSQLKRFAPLILVAGVLGAGYTYQNEIMALVMPTSPTNQPAPLPVARSEAPAPAPVVTTAPEAAAVDMVADAAEEIEAPEMAASEPMEMERESATSAEQDLIERKLAALQELEAMEQNVTEVSSLPVVTLQEAAVEESMSEEIALMEMETDHEMPQNHAMDEEGLMTEMTEMPPVAEVTMPSVAIAESMEANKWTMWQSSNQWAVQLMAVQTKEYLDEFLAENELEDGATWFEFDLNGEHYYALVIGVYNTRMEADEAAMAISETYGMQPWVRSMRSIQNIISYDFDAEEPQFALSQLAIK